MCGVAGIVDFAARGMANRDNIERMIATLHHRGPDGRGVRVDGPVALGHTRLSIIDLATGDQPIRNEDGSVWVVFNGEIFNYLELREDLASRGHQFYTHSDTEVIVHLYEEYGPDFVQHLNGQFAIALWDQARRRVVLSRDRIGIHPLYYTSLSGITAFASEVKALLTLPGVGREPDLRGLDQLFTGWAPVCPRTLYKGISELDPGCQLIIDENGQSRRRYWQWQYLPEAERAGIKESDAIAKVHDLLADAVKIRLRADVPVGAYLSGGLDSSAIAALIQADNSSQLQTFSIEFGDSALDESAEQSEMVRHLGVMHNRIRCSGHDVADNFERCIQHTEMPVLRTAPAPMMLLSRLARDSGFKVVLTGEGADEVFAGYDIFKEAKIRHFWSRFPESTWRPALLKRMYPYLDLSKKQGQAYLQAFFGIGLDQSHGLGFSHLTRWATTAKCKEFYSASLKGEMATDIDNEWEALFPAEATGWSWLQRAQFLESRTLMSGYLLSAQGDRMLMANSVEGRFPFLDHRLIEYANTLPSRFRMRGLREKSILRDAVKKYLPEQTASRTKQPYRAPDAAAFFQAGRHPVVDRYLNEEKVNRYGYFDWSKVNRLLRKAEAGKATGFKDNMAFVGMLSTQIWHERFIENGV